MKQLNSLYNSNAQELLGRITLSGKNILNYYCPLNIQT